MACSNTDVSHHRSAILYTKISPSMVDAGPLQTVLQSPNFAYNPTYLSGTTRFSQPLCGNSEGWGPLSPHRWDLTPCFLDVWVLAVSFFGILAGAGAIWYLHKKCSPEQVKKDWHFYAKMSVLGLLVATTVAQAAIQIVALPLSLIHI